MKAFKLIKGIGCVIALGLTMVVTDANAYNPKQCGIISEDQINTMQSALVAGTPHDYGWTLAAMSWRESSAGVKPLNWADPSFGPFHNNIRTVAKRYNAKNQLEEFELASRLMYDFDFAVEAAVAELDYWKKIHKGNWRKMWASYNRGWNWQSTSGQEYQADIAKKINYLKVNGCLFDDHKVSNYISTVTE